MPSFILVVDLALGVLGLYVLKSVLTGEKKKSLGPLPPGPKPRPLIGNLADLPKEYDWLHWAKHKPLYGPISSVTVFGQHLIIINDPQIAFDLLEKKSAVYSDRPTLVFGGEMCGWNQSLALQRYNDRFRAYRKNMAQVLGSRAAVARYYPHMTTETRRTMWRIMHEPEKLNNHIRTNAGAIILKISHGYTIEHANPDPLVDLADEAVEQFSLACAPGMWMVDAMPFLRYLPDWFPGTGFQRTAQRWKKKVHELVEKPHAFVKHQMADGAAFPSYTSALLEKGPLSEEDDFVVKWSSASMYSGGADTTVSAMYSFYLAMALYPDVLAKAQAEIDAVVGNDRLPTYEDRPNLPYIDALVKEALRWEPVAPMGLPHVTTEDDIYQGYYIPKGAILLSNIWQFNHDEKYFHEPFTFKPERYLGVDGREPEMDPHSLSFGFGRRICPGKELADASVYLAIAMTVAVFNITKARDENGNIIEPVHEPTNGVISHPKPYKCSITPRSAKAAALVNTVVEEHPWEPSDAEALSHVKWDLKA